MNGARALLVVLLGVAAAAVNAATAPTATSTPARWRPYDVLVELHELPRTYSCDELWHKVHDLLVRLGARSAMNITPYACGYTGGGVARSPSVEVKFELPEPLAGSRARYADTTVSEQSVRLAPGAPGSFQAGDCELMRQLQSTLLAGLPVHVSAAAFSCKPSASSFALTVEAPIEHGTATPRS